MYHINVIVDLALSFPWRQIKTFHACLALKNNRRHWCTWPFKLLCNLRNDESGMMKICGSPLFSLYLGRKSISGVAYICIRNLEYMEMLRAAFYRCFLHSCVEFEGDACWLDVGAKQQQQEKWWSPHKCAICDKADRERHDRGVHPEWLFTSTPGYIGLLW